MFLKNKNENRSYICSVFASQFSDLHSSNYELCCADGVIAEVGEDMAVDRWDLAWLASAS